MHDKTVSFLQDNFVEDRLNWNEFTRDRAHVGSLSNVALLRIYWFAQGQLDTWVGSKLPKHLNYKKVETVSSYQRLFFCRQDKVGLWGLSSSLLLLSSVDRVFIFIYRDTSSTRWGSRRIGIGNATRRFRS